MAEEQGGSFYRVEVIASLFGVSVRRVQQLTQEGIIATTRTKEGNRYELAPTIQRYVKYLSDKAYGKSKSEKEAELREQKLQAEIALKESQGEMHRLKTEIASGKYIDIEEVKMDYSQCLHESTEYQEWRKIRMKHGVYIQEQGTALTAPIVGKASVQVVIGTAPVHMAEDPDAVVNVPVLANSAAEAMAALGYTDDFQNFTLCQTMYATSNIFQVSPVVYINVLDPKKHNKEMETNSVNTELLQARVPEKGIIPSMLTVTNNETALEAGKDYTTEFDTDGTLIINLIKGGKGENAQTLTLSGKVVDPSVITKTDIIGSYNVATGAETGMELIRQVYPKLGIVPGLLLAPGWSQMPEVGIALTAKAANINGVFKAMALVDLDTAEATKYTDCKEVKENSGYTSEFCYPSWLSYKVGDYILAGSAVNAALIAYTDANNDDVPSMSPSNKLLGVTGTCLADGTEVNLDQDQANTVNSYGVATAMNMNGWKLWGNYTGAYPSSTDAKDIWLPVRRMFNWQGNTFIQSYFDKVDDPMNSILIESVVDSENIRCAAYAPDKWAGATIQYLKSDNPDTDVLAGKMTFRQSIAPYTPAQEINNILSYDIAMLSNALTGGES